MTGASPGEIVADAIAWPSPNAGEGASAAATATAATAGEPPRAIALDVVYAPRETPFLVRARASGFATSNGLGMLARQGALAFRLWLGLEPPVDAMLAAIR